MAAGWGVGGSAGFPWKVLILGSEHQGAETSFVVQTAHWALYFLSRGMTSQEVREAPRTISTAMVLKGGEGRDWVIQSRGWVSGGFFQERRLLASTPSIRNIPGRGVLLSSQLMKVRQALSVPPGTGDGVE